MGVGNGSVRSFSKDGLLRVNASKRMKLVATRTKNAGRPMRPASKEEEKQPDTTNLKKSILRQQPGQTRRDSVRVAVPKESQT